MAKKRPRKSKFNMSAAVREVLKANPKLTGKEVEAEVRKQHPRQKINSDSLNVAFSNARKKLGIKKKGSVKKLKPSASAGALDMTTLQAARKFVSNVGDVDTALEAVRQLKMLQIGN